MTINHLDAISTIFIFNAFFFTLFSTVDIIAQSRAHITCHSDLMTQFQLYVNQGVKWEIFRSIRDTCECPVVALSHLIFLS